MIEIKSIPKNSDAYDRLWDYQQMSETEFSPNRKRSALELIPGDKIQGTNVLDLCCGRGRLAAGLYDLGAKHVTCIDGSYRALEHVDTNLKNLGYSARLIQSDIENIVDVFEPESFDIVAMLFALQHQRDERKTIEDMASLVSPGGLLCFNHFPLQTTKDSTKELRSIFLEQSVDFVFDFLRDVGYLKNIQAIDSFSLTDIITGSAPKHYSAVCDGLLKIIDKFGSEEVEKRLHFEDFTTPYIHNTDSKMIEKWTIDSGMKLLRGGSWIIAIKPK